MSTMRTGETVNPMTENLPVRPNTEMRMSRAPAENSLPFVLPSA
jgi:hypothetical protein